MSSQKPAVRIAVPEPVFQRSVSHEPAFQRPAAHKPVITIIPPSNSQLSSTAHPYAASSPPPRRQKRNDRTLAFAVTFTLSVIIVIGLPLGAILPQKLVRQLPVNILVPLYSSPVLGAWEPLNDLIIKHGETIFTIIVSPFSGPGTPPYPSAPHIAAISKLKVHPNVQIVGYIDTNHGLRDKKSVINEIKTYAGWSKHPSSQLALHGVYFDRTPSTNSLTSRDYLLDISATAKHTEGFLSPMLLIHNPGRVLDANMTNSYVDITVVFEGPYEMLPSHESTKKTLSDFPGNREDYAFLVHSTPPGMGNVRLRRIVNSVRKDVMWIYVTELTENAYRSLAGELGIFLDLTW